MKPRYQWVGTLLIFYGLLLAAAVVIGLPMLGLAWLFGLKHETAMLLIVAAGAVVWLARHRLGFSQLFHRSSKERP